MHNFSFGGKNLLQFGGRILQAPSHNIAERNVEFVKIYGQSGDEIIDNESYNNVAFSIKICFFPLLSQRTAHDLAYSIIDWLGPLQNGYYEYRDTYNPGYFTQAALTNLGEVTRELPNLLTATLKFSRVPFWYRDSGTKNITAYGGTNQVYNPERYPAEPYYKFVSGLNGTHEAHITINSETVVFDCSGSNDFHRFAGKQHFRIDDGVKTYLGPELLPDLQPGLNTIEINMDGHMVSGSFYLTITPNWRRL